MNQHLVNILPSHKPAYKTVSALAIFCSLLGGCGDQLLNNPYPPDDAGKNILYSSFAERPKHLDPASAYSANEYDIIGLVYEPPFQYHYLKRPYELQPRTALTMPEPVYLDEQFKPLPADAAEADIAYSSYQIDIKPGIRYAPHPAFARGADGEYLYHRLSPDQIDRMATPYDLAEGASRELVAADYVYQIKRLAHPQIHSPLFGLMSKSIVGLEELGTRLRALPVDRQQSLDLTDYPLQGAEVLDRYRYRIVIKGKYPQFLYWLAMPFFAPMPVEAELFYAQAGLQEKNLTLDWFPVGSGPYQVLENNPNRRIVLNANPLYHDDYYPEAGEAGDAANGLLKDAGEKLPFIDQVVLSLEQESIPIWNKFQQGYYDRSGVLPDSFDQAITMSEFGDVGLTEEMAAKGIQLSTAVTSSTYYTGVNMLDPVIGGDSERAIRLRQALAIAIDQEEYIAIFRNGTGLGMQGPIPPGIFGFQPEAAGINPLVYDWIDGKARRKSLDQARQLLVEAGYARGIDPATGGPLLLNLDTPATGPDAKAGFDWLRKQFLKLGLELVIRSTNYNRFQEKMRKGTAQLFQWGWNADYPDPENFLFLFYGPHAQAISGGENSTNYQNAEFDRLFDAMRNMPNGPQRQALIDRMVNLVRRDNPWISGFHPTQFMLYQSWNANLKPHELAHNIIKYQRINPRLREQLRRQWNAPVWWPAWVLAGLALAAVIPALIGYRRALYRRG